MKELLKRFESPVVLGAIIAVAGAEFAKWASKGYITGWDVGGAVFTILIAAFAAVNNPTNREGL